MRKSYIPWIFVFFIGLFMLLDVAFVTLAQKTYTGVYTENYYQKGVDFDKINRQGIYKDKMGWKGEISYDAKRKIIKFTLRDHEGRLLSVDKVVAKILRPVTHDFDQVVTLNERAFGVYEVSHEFAGIGQWDIRIKAFKDNQEFITAKRIILMGE